MFSQFGYNENGGRIFIPLGFLKVGNDLEWGAPSFAQHKNKSNQVRFISDFRNLNTQLKQKPYPLPKINGMLLKLEVFSMLCYFI